MYTQTLIDNFNDSVLDPVKWSETQGPGANESGGTLNLPCVLDYPRVEGKTPFDLSRGIFAAKLSVTGLRAEGCEFYVGVHDGSGNHISALGAPNGSYLSFQPGGLTTFGNEVITDLTVGVGWDWVNGTWWGIGNMGVDNVIRMYNSVDGQTWNEMARCTVGGTFNKSSARMVLMAGVWNGTTPDLVANFDDASFWMVESEGESFRSKRIRFEGNWIYGIPKVRVNGAWELAHSKPKVGGLWNSPN